MKKIIIFLFSIFIVSCSSSKQDLIKLEEFEKQHKDFSIKVANLVYSKKEVSLFSKEEKDFKIDEEKVNEVIEKSKNLLESCSIIIKEDLQNDCKNHYTKQNEIFETFKNDGYLKVKNDLKNLFENRKNFDKNLKNYLDEKKLK